MTKDDLKKLRDLLFDFHSDLKANVRKGEDGARADTVEELIRYLENIIQPGS